MTCGLLFHQFTIAEDLVGCVGATVVNVVCFFHNFVVFCHYFFQSKWLHFLKQIRLFVWPVRLSRKIWSCYVETSVVFFCFDLSAYERNCLQCRRLVFFYIMSFFAFDSFSLLLSRTSFIFF